MFIRDDIHRSEIGDHYWDEVLTLHSFWEVLLFLKGA